MTINVTGGQCHRWGPVAIPKPIDGRTGIAPGDAVAFDLVPHGRVVLLKARDDERVSRFETLRGRAGPGPSTDKIMAPTRGV
jgi:antitoxin PrlF